MAAIDFPTLALFLYLRYEPVESTPPLKPESSAVVDVEPVLSVVEEAGKPAIQAEEEPVDSYSTISPANILPMESLAAEEAYEQQIESQKEAVHQIFIAEEKKRLAALEVKIQAP